MGVNVHGILLGLGLLFSISGPAEASLEIYQDGVKYRYVPVDDYVGFVKGATARCGENGLALTVRRKCPEAKRLCKERKGLLELRRSLRSVEDSLAMLKQWIRGAKPTEMSAEKWLNAAEKMGKRQAEWQMEADGMKRDLLGAKERFRKQVSSDEPVFLSRSCKNELELTMPAGVIDVGLLNEAELMGEKVKVSHFLLLRNHSGVDIASKDGRIYAHPFRRSLRPVHFSPWVVRPAPKPRPVDKRASNAVLAMERVMPEGEEAAAPAPLLSSPERLRYRDYAIGKVELPSSGEEVRVRLGSYETGLACGEISYPWRDARVYVACRFSPKQPVETDRWLLKKGRRIVSESAYGEYDRGKYLLFVDRDDEVVINRKRLVEKERSSGIFGGKVRKKDGFTLELDNKSDRQKTVKIVERIPVSPTEKIRVKLLKLNGAIRESLDEEGKLVMQVVLAPREHKEVKILFELTYDKDLKIRY